MSPKRERPIARALLWGIGLGVTASAIGVGLLVYGLVRSTLINQGIHESVLTAQMAASRLSREAHKNPGHSPVEDVADLAAGRGYLLLMRKNGVPIAASGTLIPVMPQRGWAQTTSPGWMQVQGLLYVYAREPVTLGNQQAHLLAVEPLTRTAAILRVLVKALAVGGVLLILMTWTGVLWVVRQLTDPLRSLQHEAEAMTPDRLQQELIAVETNLSEVASLTRSFNHMIQRLAHAHEREREFLANASHSLRNPVHVIRGYARTLSQWGYQDPIYRTEALKNLVRASDAMEVLIHRLLQLSRMDSEQTLVLQDYNVNAWLKQVLPDLQDACMHHPLAVEFLSEPTWVTTEAELLKTVMVSLVENADAYAFLDTEVRIELWATASHVRIAVVNQGPEIPQDVIELLFKRFERGTLPQHETRHFGLGLAIADSIVRRLGGQWDIGSHEGSTWFGVRFQRTNGADELIQA